MPPPRASTTSLTQYITFFRLCVVLFTKQGQHEKEKLALRLLATDKKYLSEKRLKFFYAHEDVQRDLVEEFKDGRKDDRCAENSTASKVNFQFNFDTVRYFGYSISYLGQALKN